MNYQASNPESLSETPERLSETKTRSGSAAKKRAAEVLTSCTNLSRDCMTVVKLFKFARASPGSDIIPGAATVLPITRPVSNHYQNFVLVKGITDSPQLSIRLRLFCFSGSLQLTLYLTSKQQQQYRFGNGDR